MGHPSLLKNAQRTSVALLIIAGGLWPAGAAVEGVAITIGISVEAKKQFAAQVNKNMSEILPTVDYFARRGTSLLEIFPRLMLSQRQGQQRYDYFEALANEKPLQSGIQEYNVSFPALDIRIVNNSAKPLLLTRATLVVSNSFVDTTPLLFLEAAPDMFEFGIDNEGWGPVEQCRIQFNLDSIKQNRVPELFTFDRTFGRFESHLAVRLDEELQRSGIPKQYVTALRDVVKIKEWYSDEKQTERVRRLKATLPGAFREEEVARLSGVITYSWRNAKGQIEQRRNPLFCDIDLVPPERGAPFALTGKYEAMLRGQGNHYDVTVPISQTVPKGGVTRFALRIGAPSSSNHRLTLKLQSTGGETLESEPISLSALVPRASAVEARSRK